MAGLPIVTNGFLAIKDGVIAALGSMEQLPGASALQIIDAEGRFVLPAFVDSHTHLVFAASREEGKTCDAGGERRSTNAHQWLLTQISSQTL